MRLATLFCRVMCAVVACGWFLVGGASPAAAFHEPCLGGTRTGDFIPIVELSSEAWLYAVVTPDGKQAVCVEILGVQITCVPGIGCCPFTCTTQLAGSVVLDEYDYDPARTGFFLTPVACVDTSGFGSICQTGRLNGIEVATTVTGSTVCVSSTCRTL